MATLEEELAGGMPPLSIGYTAPDLASLSFPWDAPAPIDPVVAPEPVAVGPEPQPPIPLQPGLGVPLEALETAAPAQPAPELGAPTDAPPAAPAPGAEFGIAPPAPAPEPVVLGPPAPTVEDYVGAPRIETNAERYSNDPLGNPVAEERQAELNRMAVSDRVSDRMRFAEIVAENDEARRQFADARKLEAINRDHEQQRMNRAARQQADQKTREAMQELLAKSERLAATKLDPTGGVTGVRRIAGVIAAIVGGLYQARTGAARNSGLDALGAAIEQGIASQRAELAAQRDVIGQRGAALNQQFAQNASDFNDDEAVRLAAWKHADDLLAVEQQNFRRGATTELRIAAERAAIAQRWQQAMTAAEQKRFEKEIKLAEVDQKQRAEERAAKVAEENARNQRAQIALGYAGLESARQDRKLARELKADEKMTEREIKREERRHKEELERAIGGEVVQIKDAAGNVIGTRLDSITKADGTVWIPKGTEAHVTRLRQQVEASTALIRTLDEMRRLQPEWLSDTANSDKLQRLKQLAGDALLQSIAAKNLGVPTGNDIELAQNFVGTTDPTRRKDSLAGMLQGRASLVRDTSVILEQAGLDKPWNPPDLSNPPVAKDTPEDRARRLVLGPPAAAAQALFSPDGSPRPVYDEAAAAEEYAKQIDPRGLAGMTPVQRVQVERDARAGAGAAVVGVRMQLEQLEAWAAQLRSSDPAVRAAAAENLGLAAGGESTPGASAAPVRERARQLLLDNVSGQLSGQLSSSSPERVR